jgi:hypothetical protein
MKSVDGVDIGLVGVPTDLGVTNRPGARHRPREIHNASSLMRGHNVGLGINPVSQPGDYVLLRAMMDCYVIFSACPMDITPVNGGGTPRAVHYEILP